MICPICDTMMESMGYGDERCPECKHTEYAETEEQFYARIAAIHLRSVLLPGKKKGE